MALFAGLVCYGLIGRQPLSPSSARPPPLRRFWPRRWWHWARARLAERSALALMLVVGCGIAFVVCASLRLGTMSNLIARPVLRGYAFGLALVIAVKQWPTLVERARPEQLLLHAAGGARTRLCRLAAAEPRVRDDRTGRTVRARARAARARRARRHHRRASWRRRCWPRTAWYSPERSTSPSGCRCSRCPARNTGCSWSSISFALMFILYAESYGSIRTFALRHDEPVEPNRDLLALGVANAVAGLFQGTPVGAGYSGTSANDAAGAQSRLAGLSAAATVLVLVLLFLRWIERIPGAGAGRDRHPRGEQVAALRGVQPLLPLAARPRRWRSPRCWRSCCSAC